MAHDSAVITTPRCISGKILMEVHDVGPSSATNTCRRNAIQVSRGLIYDTEILRRIKMPPSYWRHAERIFTGRSRQIRRPYPRYERCGSASRFPPGIPQRFKLRRFTRARGDRNLTYEPPNRSGSETRGASRRTIEDRVEKHGYGTARRLPGCFWAWSGQLT